MGRSHYKRGASAKGTEVNDQSRLRHLTRPNTITTMADFSEMARDPKHRRSFEKLLYLAAQRGDSDLVAERLSWGIDPNCSFAKGRTPLIGNVRGSCPSAATVRALLERG